MTLFIDHDTGRTGPENIGWGPSCRKKGTTDTRVEGPRGWKGRVKNVGGNLTDRPGEL